MCPSQNDATRIRRPKDLNDKNSGTKFLNLAHRMHLASTPVRDMESLKLKSKYADAFSEIGFSVARDIFATLSGTPTTAAQISP